MCHSPVPPRSSLTDFSVQVLVRGHVFLNCSLTESFCIALLEAASCGLFVVSTRVGGVPEVLPPGMIKFTEPDETALLQALVEALAIARSIVPSEMHARVGRMYSWHDVAERTERVYDSVLHVNRDREACGGCSPSIPSLGTRLLRWVPCALHHVTSCLGT